MRQRQQYHPELRQAFWHTRNAQIFPALPIPRSTRHEWTVVPPPNLIGQELFSRSDTVALVRLQAKVATLSALVRLLLTLVRVAGIKLERRRFADARAKSRLLRAVERASQVLPRRIVLNLVGITPSRLARWQSRRDGCRLQDVTTCPRSSPSQLTAREVHEIRSLIHDRRYAHVPICGLARLAARTGRVVAAASTWYRLLRQRGWRRPLERVLRALHDVGVRASRPNEFWHIDTTRVRLDTGAVAYVQAIIDNFSRKVLAWHVVASNDGSATRALLLQAARTLGLGAHPPRLVADGGGENINAAVDEALDAHAIQRVLALSEHFTHSNSLIEAFWRSLKYNLLYRVHVASLDQLTRLVARYVWDHNYLIPHNAFRGQTSRDVHRHRRAPAGYGARARSCSTCRSYRSQSPNQLRCVRRARERAAPFAAHPVGPAQAFQATTAALLPSSGRLKGQ